MSASNRSPDSYTLERRAAGILRKRYAGLVENEQAMKAVNVCAAELERLDDAHSRRLRQALIEGVDPSRGHDGLYS